LAATHKTGRFPFRTIVERHVQAGRHAQTRLLPCSWIAWFFIPGGVTRPLCERRGVNPCVEPLSSAAANYIASELAPDYSKLTVGGNISEYEVETPQQSLAYYRSTPAEIIMTEADHKK